jgi:outer membrane protein TolC
MLFFLNITSKAQESIPITKAEVLAKVAKQNTSIQISGQKFNAAKADYKQTDAIYLPNITVSYTGITTTNPLMAFGSKLNQESLVQNDFNPDLLNDPKRINNFSTKIEVQQPLINLDGQYYRKAANYKMDAMALKTSRTAEYLEFEVIKTYMELQLMYKAIDVLNQSLLAANANRDLAENNFNQGYLQRSDLLNVELRVTEVKNQLQSAKSNLQNTSNYLSFLMNENANVVYLPTDSLFVSKQEIEENFVSENRSDIKAMQLASDAYEALHKADNMAFYPRLNAFGSYELYDDKIFQGNAKGYLVGAQLSWDVFQGSKRYGKEQKSKAEFEKAKLEYSQYLSQSQLELKKAKRLLSDADQKLNLAKLALEQSEESLRIRTNRFKEGLEKSSDLIMADTLYAQKQLEYYQTIFEYNYAQAYITFLTKE